MNYGHNHLKLGSSWEETKEKIKEADPRMNDELLDYYPGAEEELFSRLKPIMHRSSEQIKVWIESISCNSAKAG